MDAQERRHPKPFEPPPWEAEQYEELRKRSQKEPTEPAEPRSVGEAVATSVIKEAHDRKEDGAGEPKPLEGAQADAAVEAMLAQLAAEEPNVGRQMRRWKSVFAYILVAVGTVITVWGMIGAFSTQAAGKVGLVGGIGLSAFGSTFLGVGLWMVFTDLRKRGSD